MMLIISGVPPNMPTQTLWRMLVQQCGTENIIIPESDALCAINERCVILGATDPYIRKMIVQSLNGLRIGMNQITVRPHGAPKKNLNRNFGYQSFGDNRDRSRSPMTNRSQFGVRQRNRFLTQDVDEFVIGSNDGYGNGLPASANQFGNNYSQNEFNNFQQQPRKKANFVQRPANMQNPNQFNDSAYDMPPEQYMGMPMRGNAQWQNGTNGPPMRNRAVMRQQRSLNGSMGPPILPPWAQRSNFPMGPVMPRHPMMGGQFRQPFGQGFMGRPGWGPFGAGPPFRPPGKVTKVIKQTKQKKLNIKKKKTDGKPKENSFPEYGGEIPPGVENKMHCLVKTLMFAMFQCKWTTKNGVKPTYAELIKELKQALRSRVANVAKNITGTTYDDEFLMKKYRDKHPLETDKDLLSELFEKCKIPAPYTVENVLLETPYTKPVPLPTQSSEEQRKFRLKMLCLDCAKTIAMVILNPGSEGSKGLSNEDLHIYEFFKVAVFKRIDEIMNKVCDLSDETKISIKNLCILYNSKYGERINRKTVREAIENYNTMYPDAPYNGIYHPDAPTMVVRKRIENQDVTMEEQSDATKEQSDATKEQSDATKEQSDATKEQSDATKEQSDETKEQSDAAKDPIDVAKQNKKKFRKTSIYSASVLTFEMMKVNVKKPGELPAEEKKLFYCLRGIILDRIWDIAGGIEKIPKRTDRCEELYRAKYAVESDPQLVKEAITKYNSMNYIPYSGKFTIGPDAVKAAAKSIALQAIGKASEDVLDAEEKKIFPTLRRCVEERMRAAIGAHVPDHRLNIIRSKEATDAYRKNHDAISDVRMQAILIADYNTKMPEPYTGKRADKITCNESDSGLREYICRDLTAATLATHIMKNCGSALTPPALHLATDMNATVQNYLHATIMERLKKIHIGESTVEEIVKKYRQIYPEENDEGMMAEAVASLPEIVIPVEAGSDQTDADGEKEHKKEDGDDDVIIQNQTNIAFVDITESDASDAENSVGDGDSKMKNGK